MCNSGRVMVVTIHYRCFSKKNAYFGNCWFKFHENDSLQKFWHHDDTFAPKQIRVSSLLLSWALCISNIYSNSKVFFHCHSADCFSFILSIQRNICKKYKISFLLLTFWVLTSVTPSPSLKLCLTSVQACTRRELHVNSNSNITHQKINTTKWRCV